MDGSVVWGRKNVDTGYTNRRDTSRSESVGTSLGRLGTGDKWTVAWYDEQSPPRSTVERSHSVVSCRTGSPKNPLEGVLLPEYTGGSR